MASENWLSEDFYKTLGVKEDASESDIKRPTANSHASTTRT